MQWLVADCTVATQALLLPAQDNATTMAALTGALRREDNNQKECRRLQKELEALQGLLQERDADLQRLKMVIKLKEGLITRLEVGPPPVVKIAC